MVDVQSDLLSHFDTRFVVPLLTKASTPLATRRLHPVFMLSRTPYVMAPHYATAVPAQQLGERVTSLAEHRGEFVAAIDVLITGV